ncbi:hypothetical protein KU6B_44070 [Mameliella alba]|nr:hypothetical protein KU6B_44070 [Mameliella alba]
MKDKAFCRPVHRHIDQRSRKQDPRALRLGPGGQQIGPQPVGHLAHAQFCQQALGGSIDRHNVGIAQRCVLPADLAWRRRTGQPLGPGCMTRETTARPPPFPHLAQAALILFDTHADHYGLHRRT